MRLSKQKSIKNLLKKQNRNNLAVDFLLKGLKIERFAHSARNHRKFAPF